jgi:hypothetical protein
MLNKKKQKKVLIELTKDLYTRIENGIISKEAIKQYINNNNK